MCEILYILHVLSYNVVFYAYRDCGSHHFYHLLDTEKTSTKYQ